MAASPTSGPRPVLRRRRRRWILGSLALLFIFGAFGLYRRATHPDRIRALALQGLQRLFHGTVSLERATFDWSDGIVLRQVAVSAVADSNAASPVLPGGNGNAPGINIPFVSLHARPWHFFLGNLHFDSVVVVGMEIRLTYDAESRRFEIRDWLAVPQGISKSGFDTLPNLDLRNVKVILDYREGVTHRTIENLILNVRSRSTKGHSPLEISWDQTGVPEVHGQVRMTRSADELRITGDLPAISTATAIAIVESLGEVPHLGMINFEPAGQLQLTQLDLRWKSDALIPQSGKVELRNARASIAVDDEERALEPTARFLRLQDVDGTMELTSQALRANLRGVFRESTLEVDIRLPNPTISPGPIDGSPWEMRIRGESVHVPRFEPSADTAEQRWLRSHPVLLSIYRDYDPQGHLDFDGLIRQTEESERPKLEKLTIAVRSGDASSRFFPYRVSHLTGGIEYGPEGLVIRNLCGTREGAHVCVDADSEHLGIGAAANVYVVGKGLPIDDELKRELSPALLKVIDQFSPRGTINLALNLSRASGQPGTRTPWQSAYRVDLNEVDAHVAELNLTASGIQGSLTVDANRRLAIDLIGQSLKTEIRATGFAQMDREGIKEFDVRLHTDRVPIEPSTVSILPDQLQTHLRALELSGSVELDARIWAEASGGPPRRMCTLRFDDLRVDDPRLPSPMDRLTGVIHLSPGFVELEQVDGCISGGELTVTGSASLVDNRATLEFTVRDLEWNEDWKAVLPHDWQTHLHDWTYDGTVFATLGWSKESDVSNPGYFTGEIGLDGNGTLFHRAMDEPLHQVTASIQIDGENFSARKVRARLGEAVIQGQIGHLTTAPGTTTRVQLDTGELPADGQWTNLLPAAVAPILNGSPTGTLLFRNFELDHWHDLETSSSRWTLNGEVGFHDFSVGSTVPVQRLTAVASGVISSDPILGLSAQGSLSGPIAILFGQEVASVEARWSAAQSNESAAWVRFEGINGTLYGGTLDASVDLQIEPGRTDYSITATMIDMSLEQWIRSWRLVQGQSGEQGDLGGLVELQIRASGTLGDVTSRRGMGRLSLANAQIYRTPLLLAILSILNLAIPSGEAFDEVLADFYLVGSRIDMNDVTLRGKGLMLFGSGTMSWPDQTVNLRFYHVSPRWWTKVPVLSDVMETAVRELIELRVTGSLSQPKVSAQPLRSLTDELKNLLQKKRPKPIQPSG